MIDDFVSVIVWCNDEEVFRSTLLPSFSVCPMFGLKRVQWVVITPELGCTNMGQAYNLAQAEAQADIRFYVHQDVLLMDRYLWQKVLVLLGQGIGALGTLGSTVDTGGGYWFAPNHKRWGLEPDGIKGLMLQSHCLPVKVLDGMLFITAQHIEWSEEYEGPHMLIEDACMQLREKDFDLWTVDTITRHISSSIMDDGFWRSMDTFNRKWAHMLPPVPPVTMFKEFEEKFNNDAPESLQLWTSGGWGHVWTDWQAQQAS